MWMKQWYDNHFPSNIKYDHIVSTNSRYKRKDIFWHNYVNKWSTVLEWMLGIKQSQFTRPFNLFSIFITYNASLHKTFQKHTKEDIDSQIGIVDLSPLISP